ncbi:MAG: Mpo1-like protein [Bacillota bacterium]
MTSEFESFKDFYPFYLGEHRNSTCRRLHFIGSALVLGALFWTLVTANWLGLILLPLFGYGFAWAGHFFFEKNRPATFTHPVYSFMGDWVMFRDILTGRIAF